MVSRALRLCPIRWRDWARIRRVLSCRLHKRRPARVAPVFLMPPSAMMYVQCYAAMCNNVFDLL